MNSNWNKLTALFSGLAWLEARSASREAKLARRQREEARQRRIARQRGKQPAQSDLGLSLWGSFQSLVTWALLAFFLLVGGQLIYGCLHRYAHRPERPAVDNPEKARRVHDLEISGREYQYIPPTEDHHSGGRIEPK